MGVSTYRLVVEWMCIGVRLCKHTWCLKKCARELIQADNLTFVLQVYWLLERMRVREAYRVVEGIEKLDISVYHGLMKGLLKLRRGSKATKVFREMIKRDLDPWLRFNKNQSVA